ncbi:hypothetical protein J7L68_03345 [bacterium]|nr:hypothetical protein [bacterium]
MEWHKILGIFIVLIAICGISFAQTEDKIISPPLFRGKLIVHFPIGAFPRDTTGSHFFWMPIPEMGFQFNPIIKFDSGKGWWEFPVHILTFFPFLDKYAALGDISIGAGFQAPPLYKFDIGYRYIAGRFYPLDAKFHGHIAELDIALPVKGFSGAGAKFEWVISSAFDMNKTFVSTNKVYNHYEGSVFAIAPYWNFHLKYGTILLAYRLVLSSKLSGTDTEKDYVHQIRTSTVSSLEFDYTYP